MDLLASIEAYLLALMGFADLFDATTFVSSPSWTYQIVLDIILYNHTSPVISRTYYNC
jgi:hypothetical protein